ncbi:MAG TPA: carbon storage regulator CsrA [Syntrophomonadaceae bacterium]|jgi:carbon storage regulator|nr:carbon storage regulator CsrA [Syntrophomonadaceae bacterium]
MLVLSRNIGESIIIGDHIEISVLDVQGDTIKLGIEAPRSLSVHRKEVYDEIQAANREASKHLPTAEQLIKLRHKQE